jgi:hypothetical protein
MVWQQTTLQLMDKADKAASQPGRGLNPRRNNPAAAGSGIIITKKNKKGEIK